MRARALACALLFSGRMIQTIKLEHALLALTTLGALALAPNNAHALAGPMVIGSVTDSASQPIAGASLRLCSDTGLCYTAISGASGSYRIIAPADYYGLTATAPATAGTPPSSSVSVILATAPVTQNFTFTRPQLNAYVYDVSGLPLASA